MKTITNWRGQSTAAKNCWRCATTLRTWPTWPWHGRATRRRRQGCCNWPITSVMSMDCSLAVRVRAVSSSTMSIVTSILTRRRSWRPSSRSAMRSGSSCSNARSVAAGTSCAVACPARPSSRIRCAWPLCFRSRWTLMRRICSAWSSRPAVRQKIWCISTMSSSPNRCRPRPARLSTVCSVSARRRDSSRCPPKPRRRINTLRFQV